MDSDTYLLGVPAIPGPTNSLLFVSGVSRGFRTNLSLIFSEVGAYLISISSLVLALAPLMRTYSTVPQLLRMACSIYLIHAGALIQSNAAQRIHLGWVYRGEAFLLA